MDILNADWKPEERETIKRLARSHHLSPMSVVRQALRLYHMTDKRLSDGEICTWSGDALRARKFYNPESQ